MKGLPDLLRQGAIAQVTEAHGVEDLDCGKRQLFVYSIQFEDALYHLGFETALLDDRPGLRWLGWTAAEMDKGIFRGRLRRVAAC